jgi:hypothetical protein
MTQSIVLRNIGPTVAISVTAASSTAVTVASTSNDQGGFASFLNTGATVIALTIAPSAITAPVSVLPVPATPQTVIMLPANMVMPVIYATPPSFSVTAIGSAAGPSLVYITPVAPQS